MPIKKGDKLAYKGPNSTAIKDGVVTIYMAGGKSLLVDEKDYPCVSRYRWYKRKHRNTYYAVSPAKDSNGVYHTLFLHKMIFPTTAGKFCDHISGNGLDNRRVNLRAVTAQQNNINHCVRKDSKTGYSGVGWSNKRKKWHSYICQNKKVITILFTNCFKKAVEARKKEEINIFGEFARVSI